MTKPKRPLEVSSGTRVDQGIIPGMRRVELRPLTSQELLAIRVPLAILLFAFALATLALLLAPLFPLALVLRDAGCPGFLVGSLEGSLVALPFPHRGRALPTERGDILPAALVGVPGGEGHLPTAHPTVSWAITQGLKCCAQGLTAGAPFLRNDRTNDLLWLLSWTAGRGGRIAVCNISSLFLLVD